MNIAEPLALYAQTRPLHPALIHEERVVLYRDLDRMVRRTAAHILSLGVKPEQIVGLALCDSIEHVVILYALARAGIVMLPIDWRWTPGEQFRIADHFGAHLLLVEPDRPVVDGKKCVAINEDWRTAIDSAPSDLDFPVDCGPLLMSLSSGTTGRPKGPLLTHAQFYHRFLIDWINLGFNAQDRYVSMTPLYFGGGRTFAMLMLYSGATVILFPPPYEPEQMCAEIERHRATATFLVPTLLRRLLALDDATLAPLRAMRKLIASGSSLHSDERALIRGRICPGLIVYYSSTEGGGVSCLAADEPAQYDESVGRPVFGVEVQCVDENHQPLPAGQTGRVRYSSPGSANSFWNDDAASAESFRGNWYYPGDLGQLDDAGYLTLRGRAKDMIIRGGINVYPTEVEAILQNHPAVLEAAVVGWPSREFNEEIAAFVILNSADQLALVKSDELRKFCKERIASYKVPREVFIVDEFPRSSLGKTLKADLTARLEPL